MNSMSRRLFHQRVGEGMLSATIGATLAREIGLVSNASGAEALNDSLSFGDLEPLVGLMEHTPADKLLPVVVKNDL